MKREAWDSTPLQYFDELVLVLIKTVKEKTQANESME
jgi:hypothetical protein